jgi:hypothetical protein
MWHTTQHWHSIRWNVVPGLIGQAGDGGKKRRKKTLHQGWQTFLRMRAQIVYKF